MTSNRIEQNVLKEIKDGRVEMRSRRSVVIGRVTIISSLIASCLLMFIFVSFILHALQQSGVLYLPTFGTGVFRYLLHPFSWFILSLIVITNAIAVVMALVIGRATVAYRTPFLYIWAAVFLVITTGAVVLFVTPFHDRMHSISSTRHLPVIESLYRSAIEDTDAHTSTGLVRNVRTGGFDLVMFSRRIMDVATDADTVVTDEHTIQDGEVVIVVGDTNGRTITAEFIRKYPGTLSNDEMNELERFGSVE